MWYGFITCDVFTETRFGGNPLAVLPDAVGLDAATMQRIAREFNYSETTFVLPPENGQTRRVRIFAPTQEVPFAGHPNVGTADDADIRARMFAPLRGIVEDPATGSAGCTVAGLLAHHAAEPNGSFTYSIAQGVEMGRPSALVARAQKAGGVVTATWIGGACVPVAEGRIQVR